MNKRKKYWHYQVIEPNGDSCTFANKRTAERIAIKIANAFGKCRTKFLKLTRAEYRALPVTTASARIAAL